MGVRLTTHDSRITHLLLGAYPCLADHLCIADDLGFHDDGERFRRAPDSLDACVEEPGFGVRCIEEPDDLLVEPPHDDGRRLGGHEYPKELRRLEPAQRGG